MRKLVVLIIDGPPASGKTTLSKVISSYLNCVRMKYKALGVINIISALLINTIFRRVTLRKELIKRKEDPVLLLDLNILIRLRHVIFLTELVYKALQAFLLIMTLYTLILLSFYRQRCLVIDEFLVLRTANYINLHIHGGLSGWHLMLLRRLDMSVFQVLTRCCVLRYIYIDRSLREILDLWNKREMGKPYSYRYLAIVRLVWKEMSSEMALTRMDLKIPVYVQSRGKSCRG